MVVVKILVVKSVVYRVNSFMPRLNSIQRDIFQLCSALIAQRKTFNMIISWIPLCQFYSTLYMNNTSYFDSIVDEQSFCILYLFDCFSAI